MDENNHNSKVIVDVHREKLNLFIRKLKHSVNLGNDFKRKVNIKIKYFFEVNKDERKSSIEMKVGEEKLYVIKNSRNFLSTVRHKEVMEFGKHFYYNGRSCEFRGEDYKVIKLLMELHDISSFVAEDGATEVVNQKIFKGKRTYLTPNYVKRMFSYLVGKKIDLNIYGREFENIEVVEGELPLEFTVKEDNEEFYIEQKGKMAMPLITEGGIFFFKNKIYITTERQNELYKYFYNMLREKDGMRFKKDDLGDIGTYVIPLLQSISTEIDLDNNITKRFHDEELKANIFLDREGNNIIASLRYEYGDITFNPLKSLSENYNSQLVIRNIKEEKLIEKIFKVYGFEEHGFNLLLKEADDILRFLSEGVEKLQDKGSIYHSDNFKKLRINRAQSINSKLNIVKDFLEFDFSIEGVEKDELKNILESLEEKKNYYRLKNGSFLDLNSNGLIELHTILDYLDVDLKDVNGEKLLLSKYNALYLNQKLNENDIFENENNEYVNRLCENLGKFKRMNFKLHPNLEAILRPYQKVGFDWLKTIAHYDFGGILADEMGLGKTIQAISLMASLEEGEEQGISLVVCPTSLVYNWKYELEKFAPKLRVSIISGNKDSRDSEIEAIKNGSADVLISSYGLIRNDIEQYKTIDLKYCFLDEAQNIKNYNSLVSIAVKQLYSKSKFALTGTPIENSLMELWSIFDFIMPGYLLSRHKFTAKYEAPIVKQKQQDVLIEFNNHVKPFILRRLKQEVAIELPPKIEHKLMVDMTLEQKKVYAAYTLSYKEEIDDEISKNGFSKSKFKILALLTKLRQLCCDPSIILENYNGSSGKLQILDELLDDMLEGGHRILIFSQFTRVLKSISNMLQEKNIEYYYLDGSTKSEERMNLVNKFNEGTIQVFLISLKAGGTGLNLTGADVVIHFDPWWNPAVEAQATDRSHRIGQKKRVEVIKLISKGTIEEKIYKLQESKKQIIDSVMNNMDEGFLWDMQEEDIKSLFEV